MIVAPASMDHWSKQITPRGRYATDSQRKKTASNYADRDESVKINRSIVCVAPSCCGVSDVRRLLNGPDADNSRYRHNFISHGEELST
jgi:hypothetical protein